MQTPIRVTSAGLRLMALTTQTTSTTLMLNDGGSGPRVIRLVSETSYVHVAVGGTDVTVGLDCMLVNTFPQLMSVRGQQYIKVMSPAATVFLNVIPIEL